MRCRTAINCGGYALGKNVWLSFPFEGEKNTKEKLAKFFETEFCARVINDESEVQDDEYLVLFRTSHESIFNYFSRLRFVSDFHFVIKKGRNYFHKRGSYPVIERMKKEEVYSDCWCDMYDSEIMLLAKKKDLYAKLPKAS